MISLFSGTPGAGKSLHLACILYNRMRMFKRPIIGNFNCDFSRIKHPRGTYVYCDNLDLTPDYLIKYSNEYSESIGRRVKEGEILLVIDECQIIFNSFYSHVICSGTKISNHIIPRRLFFKQIQYSSFYISYSITN